MNAMLEQALSTVTDLSGDVAEVKAGALKMATGIMPGQERMGRVILIVWRLSFRPDWSLLFQTTLGLQTIWAALLWFMAQVQACFHLMRIVLL